MQQDYFSETNFIKSFTRILSRLQNYDYAKKMVITSQTYLYEQLDLDSLDVMMAIIDLEKKYGVRTPDENHEKIQTVGDLYKLFATCLVNKNKQNMTQSYVQKVK